MAKLLSMMPVYVIGMQIALYSIHFAHRYQNIWSECGGYVYSFVMILPNMWWIQWLKWQPVLKSMIARQFDRYNWLNPSIDVVNRNNSRDLDHTTTFSNSKSIFNLYSIRPFLILSYIRSFDVTGSANTL